MKIQITYNGEPVVITTDTDDPDELTSYILNPGVSIEAQTIIGMVTRRGLGAFGHRMGGSVNNRDLISALANEPGIELIGEYPMAPYEFPEGTMS